MWGRCRRCGGDRGAGHRRNTCARPAAVIVVVVVVVVVAVVVVGAVGGVPAGVIRALAILCPASPTRAPRKLAHSSQLVAPVHLMRAWKEGGVTSAPSPHRRHWQPGTPARRQCQQPRGAVPAPAAGGDGGGAWRWICQWRRCVCRRRRRQAVWVGGRLNMQVWCGGGGMYVTRRDMHAAAAAGDRWVAAGGGCRPRAYSPQRAAPRTQQRAACVRARDGSGDRRPSIPSIHPVHRSSQPFIHQPSSDHQAARHRYHHHGHRRHMRDTAEAVAAGGAAPPSAAAAESAVATGSGETSPRQ